MKRFAKVYLCLLGVIFMCEEGAYGIMKDHLMSIEPGSSVVTKNGEVQGLEARVYYLNDELLDYFLGIPYAKPLTRENRFKKPDTDFKWTKTLMANKAPKSCPQMISTKPLLANWQVDETDEDCLYLNVYLPSKVSKKDTYAVMVWVHGGGFDTGSSTLDVYDARYLAYFSETIVVSMNYRLGALGFLNLNTNSVSGNVGLLDQAAALEWVKENIGAFGGNPDKVTLFGEEAGAVSASLHLLSPVSEKTFQTVILQSGSALSPWAVVPLEEAQKRSRNLASSVGCKQKIDKDIATCMRSVSLNKILKAQSTVVGGSLQFAFCPTVDGKFLKDSPQRLLNNNNFTPRPILAGSNKNEATSFRSASLDQHLNPSTMDQFDFKKVLKSSFASYSQFPSNLKKTAYTAIEEKYSPAEKDKNIMLANFNAVNMALTDSEFICPMYSFLSEWAKKEKRVYSYLFTEPFKHNLTATIAVTPHSSEISYLFSTITKWQIERDFGRGDINFSKKIMQMWGNFARTRNPNCKGVNDQDEYPKWPKFDPYNQRYLELNSKYVGQDVSPDAIGEQHRMDFCPFWKEIENTLN